MDTTKKFHINNDGEIRLCRATKKECEFEKNGGHFTHPVDAKKKVEENYAEEFGEVKSFRKLEQEKGRKLRKSPPKPILMEELTLEEAFAAIRSGEEFYNVGGIDFPLHRDRLELFTKSELKCVTCGVEATHARAEARSLNRRNHSINFYGRKNGKRGEVLFTKDHVLPKSLGGSNHVDNYQIMCHICNGVKGNSEAVDYRPGKPQPALPTLRERKAMDRTKRLAIDLGSDSSTLPPIWLPGKASLNLEPRQINAMKELAKPSLVYGKSEIVAETVVEAIAGRTPYTKARVVTTKTALGRDHSAVAYEKDGQTWIMDYAYAEVDAYASWPKTAKLEAWRNSVKVADDVSVDILESRWRASH